MIISFKLSRILKITLFNVYTLFILRIVIVVIVMNDVTIETDNSDVTKKKILMHFRNTTA